LLVFNGSYYKSEFKKLNIYENFTSKEEVDIQATKLIKYLCCDSNLEGDFYSEREKLHLADVKNLIRLTTIQFLLTLSITLATLLVLIINKKTRLLLFSLRWASLVCILAIFTLWLSAFIKIENFQKSFITFHEVAFENDLWQMSPQSNLIKLFPEQFFADFANRIALQTIIMSIVIFSGSYLIKRNVTKSN